ncbi:MAG: PfkB family carbohydrate kinase [Actinomycetaceae bacterium]|nr:PfkB family carbohydrate kinase [Actinomycetaceae bacterium]
MDTSASTKAKKTAAKTPTGFFVGLSTFDVIQYVEKIPGKNQKVTAVDQALAAGGPALNAAVVFAALGGKATLISAVGDGPVGTLIRQDLQRFGITLIDCATPSYSPAVSSIVVQTDSGDRQIISTDTGRGDVDATALLRSWDSCGRPDVYLIDGHLPTLARSVLDWSAPANVPVVADGGRWKPAFDELLPFVSHLVCSSDFRPPQDSSTSHLSETDRFTVLKSLQKSYGIPSLAQTRGADSVLGLDTHDEYLVEVPSVEAQCTLGAGDFFHGAVAFHLASHPSSPFSTALGFAARVSAIKCSLRGTRAWLENPQFLRLKGLHHE